MEETYIDGNNIYIQTIDNKNVLYDKRGYVLLIHEMLNHPICIGKSIFIEEVFGKLSFKDLKIKAITKEENENEMKNFNCDRDEIAKLLEKENFFIKWGILKCIDIINKSKETTSHVYEVENFSYDKNDKLCEILY
jgi:hypothetical protein